MYAVTIDTKGAHGRRIAVFIFDRWHVPKSQYQQCASISQQIRDFDPMLYQCWASVVNGGPTLLQHWVDVPCLLKLDIFRQLSTTRDIETLSRCRFNARPASATLSQR